MNNKIMDYIEQQIEDCNLRIECAVKRSDTKREVEYLSDKREVLEYLYCELEEKFFK